jgi:hypothetical protein
MSTAVSLFGAGAAVPAHIAARELNATTIALAGTPASGKRISIKGGVWRLIVNGKEVSKNTDRKLSVAIVRTAPANSRTYYEGTYKEGEVAPPACSSNDGIKPDAHIKNPQASSCDKCPQNIAGSGNGESRACRYSRRVAVVLEGDLSGDVYQLQLPATSIFGKGNGTQNLPLEAYARMLAQNRVNIDSVITRLEFDTDSPTPKITFSPERYLTAEELTIVEEQGLTEEAEQAVGRTPYMLDTQSSPAPAPAEHPVVPPTSKKTSGFQQAGVVETEVTTTQKTTKTKPAVAADDDGAPEQEEVAEPTKAVQETPRASNIKSVLDAWAD